MHYIQDRIRLKSDGWLWFRLDCAAESTTHHFVPSPIERERLRGGASVLSNMRVRRVCVTAYVTRPLRSCSGGALMRVMCCTPHVAEDILNMICSTVSRLMSDTCVKYLFCKSKICNYESHFNLNVSILLTFFLLIIIIIDNKLHDWTQNRISK